MQFLMDNSVLIVFLITAAVLGRSEYKRYLRENGLSSAEAIARLRRGINEIGESLFPKLLATLLISLLISMVSFREIFVPDVFHIVFLTMLLARPTSKLIKKLFQ
jgi:hypothetical protein